MHIRPMTRVQPKLAFNIEQILDISTRIINLIESLERLLDFDLSEIVDTRKEGGPPQG